MAEEQRMERRHDGSGAVDRRRGSGDFRVRPRSSPANILVLMVTGAVLAAGAASLLWGGFGDRTPHGRLLGVLNEVAEAQESHWEAEGRFARWAGQLSVPDRAGMDVLITGDAQGGWEAVATDREVGLSCRQRGRLTESGLPERLEPVCFTTSP